MKKLLLGCAAGLLLALVGCPEEQKPDATPPPPPVSQPASVPAEPPAATPEEAKARLEITDQNVADYAKAMDGELDKDIEAAKNLGKETK
ncbi:MAG: hypothetical protein JXR83_09185 [Deltaproteobacteria bacterium]|nr:hypothetical protein [Deltaproteobacteria bacterium]